MRGGVFVWSYQKYGNPNYSDILKYARSVDDHPVVIEPPPRPPNPTPVPSPTPSVPDTIPDSPDGVTDPPDCPCPCHLTDTWKPWVSYNVGVFVVYNGTKYSCIQRHTSQPDWVPSDTPSLWRIV